jgi:hypothetical protein
MNKSLRLFLVFLAAGLAAGLYAAYLVYTIHTPGPIDYQTFIEIGYRWLSGAPIYGGASYYPLPMVAIFAFLAWLPRSLSLTLWLTWPALAAVLIAGPEALLFAPLFANFAGAQTAGFAMLGFWGYRHYKDRWLGGALLALATFKPQLAIIPVGWALCSWMRQCARERHVPPANLGFLAACGLLWLPSLLVYPRWPLDWLANPRPFMLRAMAGIVPRSLAWLLPGWFWAGMGLALVLAAIWAWKKRFDLDRLIVLGFIVSPLLHDYDLVQLMPILEDKSLMKWAILAGIPMWITLLFFYGTDTAWWTATLIAPALLLAMFARKPELSPRRWLAMLAGWFFFAPGPEVKG